MILYKIVIPLETLFIVLQACCDLQYYMGCDGCFLAPINQLKGRLITASVYLIGLKLAH